MDPTTGLAHCYESDKAQPGRPWYERSRAFHIWLADAMGVPPLSLAADIDRLFRWAIEDLAIVALNRTERFLAGKHRSVVNGDALPIPGDDPELMQLISDTLSTWLTGEPPAEVWRQLTRQIRAYVGQENKRKNLLGEGFEDTMSFVLRAVPAISSQYDILVRRWLHDIPGFYAPRRGEKPRQVDLALVHRRTGRRILVTCKWSVRSDREEQFFTDYSAYSRLESAGESFDYVLLTNEFDPARLSAACENRQGPSLLFTSVVHINPDGPAVALAALPDSRRAGTSGAQRLAAHRGSGRLSSLAKWLGEL